MFTEMFWSFMITSIIACVLALAQYIFKSKCDNIECGCIKIHRAVDLESNEGLPQIELPQPLQRQSQSRGPSLDSITRRS